MKVAPARVSVAPGRGTPTTLALVTAVLAGANDGPGVVVALADSPVPAGIATDAVLIVSADDGDLVAAAAAFVGVSLSVGYSAVADLRALNIAVDETGTSFDAVSSDSRIAVRLAMVGERHVPAALAAILAGRAAGLGDRSILDALAHVPTAESGNLELISTRPGFTLLDDSYDSTSLSTTEALKTVAEIAGESRRSIAVLSELSGIHGDIRDEHDRIGRIIVRLNIGLLVAIGSGARHLAGAAGLEGSWDGESVLVADTDEAYDLVRAEIREGDVILVKSGPIGTNTLGHRIGELLA